MNFVAHAYVASWQRGEAAFALGAMLPDWFGMLGQRLPAVPSSVIAEGVAHHHAVDEVFHASPTFLALQGRTRALLEERGAPRGPARAVAHIGVELLLDGVLGREAEVRRVFDAAGDEARALDPAHALALGPLAASAWSRMVPRLLEADFPVRYGDVRFVAARLGNILEDRPRLALSPHVRAMLPGVLADVQASVEATHGALLAEVRAGL